MELISQFIAKISTFVRMLLHKYSATRNQILSQLVSQFIAKMSAFPRMLLKKCTASQNQLVSQLVSQLVYCKNERLSQNAVEEVHCIIELVSQLVSQFIAKMSAFPRMLQKYSATRNQILSQLVSQFIAKMSNFITMKAHCLSVQLQPSAIFSIFDRLFLFIK